MLTEMTTGYMGVVTMDTLNLNDMIYVIVPESFLSILIALIVCKGNAFKSFCITIGLVLKLLLTSIVITALIFFSRRCLSNIVAISLCTTVIYILALKIMWKFNIRQSVISGIISFIILMMFDIFTFPFVDAYTAFIKENIKFFDFRFIFSLPSRLLQIIIVFVLLKFKINLSKNKLINESWSKLTPSNKGTIINLFMLMLFAIIVNTNYVELFIKLKMHNIDSKIISFNSQLILIESIIFVSLVLMILNIAIDYTRYKDFLNRKTTEVVSDLFKKNSQEEIYQCATDLIMTLYINQYSKLEKMLMSLNNRFSNFNFTTDNEIEGLIFDYTYVVQFLEYLLALDIMKNNEIVLNISSFNNDIMFELFIYCNDIVGKNISNIIHSNRIIQNIIGNLLIINNLSFKIKQDDALIITMSNIDTMKRM
jgi:hypothetical protein